MKSPINLPPFGDAPNEINAIVETPQGSRNKFDFDPETGLFELGSPMPAGVEFPFEFGFIPSTLADDGDPLDVLILMDAPTFVGCLVHARLVGVLKVKQTEKGGKPERNDRLIAVARNSRRHRDIKALADLSDALLAEIEHFFLSYNEAKGKQLKVLGRFGPRQANALVKRAIAKRKSDSRNATS